MDGERRAKIEIGDGGGEGSAPNLFQARVIPVFPANLPVQRREIRKLSQTGFAKHFCHERLGQTKYAFLRYFYTRLGLRVLTLCTKRIGRSGYISRAHAFHPLNREKGLMCAEERERILSKRERGTFLPVSLSRAFR